MKHSLLSITTAPLVLLLVWVAVACDDDTRPDGYSKGNFWLAHGL